VTWLAAVGLIILLLVVYLPAGVLRGQSRPSGSWVTGAKIAGLSRNDIGRALTKIERSPSPQATPGACCYAPIPQPLKAEYICPVCGRKTIHAGEQSYAVSYGIEECRRELIALKKVAGSAAALDESDFCRKCNPGAKNPALKLRLRFSDGSTRVVPTVTADDLRMLTAFFGGKLEWKGSNESANPLKVSLPRLRELLGTDAANGGGK
jgi:hypothetical protein